MSDLLIVDARIAGPAGVLPRGWLDVRAGAIAAIGAGDPEGRDDAVEVVEAAGALLLPGFVDVHVHGALGHEAMDGDPAGLAVMAEFYARHGVTAFLATTWTADTADTLAALAGVARGVRELEGGARLLGAHMEGPYLNPRRCGAQDAGLIRPADLAEAERFLASGVVRLVTLAPEVEGNLALVAACARRGVCVSAGHSDATYEEMRRAIAAGVRHVTHTFNAMRPLHHREPGVVGAAMTVSELSVELIADLVHVHPAALCALLAARGVDAVVLVTDAMRATGMPDGTYPIGGRTAHLRDGAVRLPDGALAGSVLTLDAALRNLSAVTGQPAERLWPAASRTAARVAGVGDRKGTLAPGFDADLVLLDDALEVLLTVVEGRVVHRRPAAPASRRPPAPRGSEAAM